MKKSLSLILAVVLTLSVSDAGTRQRAGKRRRRSENIKASESGFKNQAKGSSLLQIPCLRLTATFTASD
jgi:hypothetical protein